ncbi:MAG: glycosyltransferase family 4 protein [Bdellovibrionales bacterium]|nr:glycosyltransferase family 4 protein [Bdellovibrionales bacterium]
MKIAFYLQSCLPVHARSIEQRALGGMETAIIRLAEELNRRSHEVTVYTSDPNPPDSKPLYLPISAAGNMPEQDAVIVVREWFPLVGTIPTKKRYYWTADAPDKMHNIGVGDKRVVQAIDGLLVASEWQAKVLAQSSGFPAEKICVIGNGVHLPWFQGQEVRERKRLIFTAAPFRGLAYLPVIFENLKKRHTDLSMHIFSGMDIYASEKNKAFQEQVTQQYAATFESLRRLQGVQLHGNIKQKDLAREYMKSALLCLPNNVLETSSAVAFEAQAAGCVPITSAKGALPEIMGQAGLVVNRPVETKEYIRDFIIGCDQLLTNDELWTQLSEAGKLRAKAELSWQAVANRLEAQLLADLGMAKSSEPQIQNAVQAHEKLQAVLRGLSQPGV